MPDTIKKINIPEAQKYFKEYSVYQKFLRDEYLPAIQEFDQGVGYAAQLILAKLDIVERSSVNLAEHILKLNYENNQFIKDWLQDQSKAIPINKYNRQDLILFFVSEFDSMKFGVEVEELKQLLKLLDRKKALQPKTNDEIHYQEEQHQKYEEAWDLCSNKQFILNYKRIDNKVNENFNWTSFFQLFKQVKLFRVIFK